MRRLLRKEIVVRIHLPDYCLCPDFMPESLVWVMVQKAECLYDFVYLVMSAGS